MEINRRKCLMALTGLGSAGLSGCTGILEASETESETEIETETPVAVSDGSATVTVTATNDLPDVFSEMFDPEGVMVPVFDFWEGHSTNHFSEPVQFEYQPDGNSEDSDITVVWSTGDSSECEPVENPDFGEGTQPIACAGSPVDGLPSGETIDLSGVYDARMVTAGLKVAVGRLFGVGYGFQPNGAMTPRKQLFPFERLKGADGMNQALEPLHRSSGLFSDLYSAVENGNYQDALNYADEIRPKLNTGTNQLNQGVDGIEGNVDDEYHNSLEDYSSTVEAYLGHVATLESLAEEEDSEIPDSVPGQEESYNDLYPTLIEQVNYEVWAYYVENE